MKILLFANTDWYLYNFRLSLIKAIRNLDIEVVLVAPPGNFSDRLKAEGFRLISIPMNRRSLNPWLELKLIISLISIYRSERPDLVHHFTIKPVVYGSIAARFAGVAHRVNAITGLGHVFISETIRANMLRPMVRLLIRFALFAPHGRLILQNGDDQDLFLKNKLVEPQHIRIIRGSGVNMSKFIPSNKNCSARKPVRVLLGTRLLWEKGVGEYVEAARLLKNEGAAIEFLIAGSPDDGNPASVPRETINQWAEEGIIVALGHIDDMSGLLGKVDIVVLPSYREGTPRILLEAAASGLPLISTDVPGCREIVISDVNGLLVPAKNARALVEAIRYLADNPNERERMGKEGRRKVLEEFDENIVINETLGVYKELVPNLMRTREEG